MIDSKVLNSTYLYNFQLSYPTLVAVKVSLLQYYLFYVMSPFLYFGKTLKWRIGLVSNAFPKFSKTYTAYGVVLFAF